MALQWHPGTENIQKQRACLLSHDNRLKTEKQPFLVMPLKDETPANKPGRKVVLAACQLPHNLHFPSLFTALDLYV